MWPFKKLEKRSAYVDLIIDAVVNAAESNVRNASATSAMEAASGLYANCFAGCTHNGPKALTPSLLSETARRLIRHGEIVYVIEVKDGEIQLRQASSWTITGGYKPESWKYRCEVNGPTKSISKNVPASGVLHFRYSVDPINPWEGLSPLANAATTNTLAGSLERKVQGEVSDTASAYLLPIPQDGGSGEESDPLKTLKSDIKKGGLRLVETTASGWAEGQANAPRRDLVQSRLGPDIPPSLSDLRKEVFQDVLRACQIPVSLFTDADGTSQRESWRRFVMGSVEPLSQLVAEECERKLELDSLDFDFRYLWAHDLAGRAQALDRLVKAGEPLADAKATVGL